MNDNTRQDIRSLLKTFGIQADEAIMDFLDGAPGEGPLHVRLTLSDLTDYGDSPPAEPLHLEIEGQVRRA
jgi:hypothetical protein